MEIKEKVGIFHYMGIDPNKKRSDKSGTQQIDSYYGLSELNDSGYNVYKSLNTFFSQSSRKEIDVCEFVSVGIDIDLGKDGSELNTTKDDILSKSLKFIGVLPTTINKTYKGFHVFFDFNEDLWYMDSQTYKTIVLFIRGILNGDTEMKMDTGILRVPGFKDWKTNKETGEIREFVIKTIYNGGTLLTKDILQNLGINITFRDENKIKGKLSTKELRKNRKGRNLEHINSIDSLDFITKIQENISNPSFSFINNFSITKVNENQYNFDDTDGLKLFYNDGMWKIKDFSGHNRFTNDFFVKNHLLKDIDKDKKFEYAEKIFSLFGVSSNFSGSYVSQNLGLSIVKKELVVTNRNVKTEMDDDILKLTTNNGNKERIQEFENIYGKDTFLKFIFGFFSIVSNFEITKKWKNGYMYTKMNDILDEFNLSHSTANRKMMEDFYLTLHYLEKTSVIKDEIDGDINEIIIKGFPFTVGIGTSLNDGSKTIVFKIEDKWVENKFFKIANGIHNITKTFKESGNTYGLVSKILAGVQKYGKYEITNKELIKNLGLTCVNESLNNKKGMEFVEKCRKSNVFQDFSFDGHKYTLYKYKRVE